MESFAARSSNMSFTGIFLAMMWPPFCKIWSTIAPNIILQKISQGGAEIWIDGAHS
jgi:hypothetical protein